MALPKGRQGYHCGDCGRYYIRAAYTRPEAGDRSENTMPRLCAGLPELEQCRSDAYPVCGS